MAGLSLNFEDGVCFVVINNAENGNSFGVVEAKQLEKLLKSKEFKACRGLVWLTPDGGPFCSGGNLKYYAKQKKRADGIKANREIRNALDLLRQSHLPTVAVVSGSCFGGGMELLACFDFVVATPKALFGLWQRRISLTFGWGGASRMTENTQLRHLKGKALLANTFSVFEAAQMGIVDQVTSIRKSKNVATRLIDRASSFSSESARAIKSWALKPTRATEVIVFEDIWHNPEHKSVLKKI